MKETKKKVSPEVSAYMASLARKANAKRPRSFYVRISKLAHAKKKGRTQNKKKGELQK